MWLSGALASPRAAKGGRSAAEFQLPCARCSPVTAASCNLSKSQTTVSLGGFQPCFLFWTKPQVSTVCYITAAVMQPCNDTQPRLGFVLFGVWPQVSSSCSVHRKDAEVGLGSKEIKLQRKRTVGKNKRFIQFLISMGLQHVSLSMCKIQTNKKSLSYKLPSGQKVRNLARVVNNVIRVSVVSREQPLL